MRPLTLEKGGPMEESVPREENNSKTILFMVVLSFICALVLSVLASALAKPKELAKDLDRSKQLLIASKILSHSGYFIIQDKEGKDIPAKFENGALVPGNTNDIATQEQLLKVYETRITPLFVNDKGETKTVKEANINLDDYVATYKKTGYYKQPLKLVYAIIPFQSNETNKDSKEKKDSQPSGYVIPVNGFGLWDAIYGYLAIKPDADTVLGISWYDQKETPGLGANISEEEWQRLFPGKKIFQPSASGKTDFADAPLGITVVKGKVRDVLGDSPKAQSAVDGMAGATLTGNGVTDAYREVLAAYKPFLLRLHEQYSKEAKEK